MHQINQIRTLRPAGAGAERCAGSAGLRAFFSSCLITLGDAVPSV
jgi:hypothetical protein